MWSGRPGRRPRDIAGAIRLRVASRSVVRRSFPEAGFHPVWADVQVGLCKPTATGAGFKDFVAEQIRITSRETRRIDIAMEIGPVGTSVSVSAEVAVIATEGAQSGRW